MTIKEKAKAYDEVVERITNAVENGFVSDNFGRDMLGIEESEDERIRKQLIEGVQEQLSNIPAPDCMDTDDIKRYETLKSWLAWLEKQKETQFTKRNVLFDKCVAKCDPAVMKEVSDNVDKMLEKEQEPATPSNDELQRHQDKLYDFKVFAAKQAKENHISFVRDFEWNNFCEAIMSYSGEQREVEKSEIPTNSEWSEDFEDNIRILLHDKLTWHSEDGSMSSTVFIDDKTLKDIISGIWFYVGKESHKYPNKELKVSDRKPSEEQMKDLFIAAREGCEVHSPTSNTLKSLYDDLKKLM